MNNRLLANYAALFLFSILAQEDIQSFADLETEAPWKIKALFEELFLFSCQSS